MKKLRKIIAVFLTAMMFSTLFAGTAFAAPAGEIHGVWISFLDWQANLKGKGEADFTSTFSAMCDNVLAHGGNAVIVHVRSHNDAVYPSAIYPWSTTMLNGDPGFDPLATMVSVAHSKGLSFHAWINPYGYRNGAYAGNPALATQDNIVAGVSEIVNNYAVDGVHFDDYFPPLGAEAHNSMVSRVYGAAHAAGKVFGISPQGNVENNMAAGADVRTWLSTPGYVDYLAPQIYWSDNYGAAGTTTMFTNRLNQWAALNTAGVQMYLGMAAYRAGNPLAADPGWMMRSDNLVTQANQAAGKGWGGYFLYSYATLNSPNAQAELSNLMAR